MSLTDRDKIRREAIDDALNPAGAMDLLRTNDIVLRLKEDIRRLLDENRRLRLASESMSCVMFDPATDCYIISRERVSANQESIIIEYAMKYAEERLKAATDIADRRYWLRHISDLPKSSSGGA